MEVKSAVYVSSAPTVSLCPKDTKAEYAFVGRSNVGKSSLINMLCGSKALAKTSATPGKTMLINHFLINGEWYLVDLPGYGYAKRSKRETEKIGMMMRGYLQRREQLMSVFVLVDIRHEAQRIDLDFINSLGAAGIPFAIVFTKADKISAGRTQSNVAAYKIKLTETWDEFPPIFVTSSEKGTGRDELLDYIDSINRTTAKP